MVIYLLNKVDNMIKYVGENSGKILMGIIIGVIIALVW